LAATATSNLPVAIRVVSGTATVAGGSVTATAGGETVLELTQAGNDNFNAAPAVQVRFVAIPNITLTSLSAARFCGGSTLTVNYTTDGTFPVGNVMAAYISDAAGNFANAINLGNFVQTTSGSLQGIIPTDLPSGTGYRVQVRGIVYGAVSNSSPAITVDKLPERPFINYSNDQKSLVAVVVPTGVTLQWFRLNADNSTTAAGSTATTFAPPANGNYLLGITSNGCTVFSNALSFSLPVVTGSNDLALEQATEIYPNPHEGSVNVKTVLKKAGSISIVVTDVVGKTVYTHTETAVAGKYEHTLRLENLASGVYMVALTTDGKSVVKKTVKQ
jgi:Secretion system C-terminal sorting domain